MDTIENGCSCIYDDYYFSPSRKLTEAEKELVWKKPLSHRISEEELRICKEIKRNWNQGELNVLLQKLIMGTKRYWVF